MSLHNVEGAFRSSYHISILSHGNMLSASNSLGTAGRIQNNGVKGTQTLCALERIRALQTYLATAELQ
jgi:hypothetical protein